MKRYGQKHSGINAALLGAALLATCGFATAADNTIVSGSYTFTRPDGITIESVNFQAIQRSDGSVIGEVHNSLRTGETIIFVSHLRIDCMEFVDENTVVLAGVDVFDSDPDYIGNTVGIFVRDNGEGQAASPDQGTTMYYSNDVGFGITCQVALDLVNSGAFNLEARLRAAETGNIQIVP